MALTVNPYNREEVEAELARRREEAVRLIDLWQEALDDYTRAWLRETEAWRVYSDVPTARLRAALLLAAQRTRRKITLVDDAAADVMEEVRRPLW